MHIPDSMLQGAICPISAAISIGGIVAATYLAAKSSKTISSTKFAGVTALIFALQMLNFPIQDGTSGHLLGGVLAAQLIGTPLAILALSLVVTIQALIFSDGGLTVLGVNLLNMAIIGAGIGGWLANRLTAIGYEKYISCAFAAWFSVVLAAFAVSLELSLSGTIPFFRVVGVMLTTHSIIGLGEALLTLICVASFSLNFSAIPQRQGFIAITAAFIIAVLFSHFASLLPDGLEWVAQQYGFFSESAPAFSGWLHNYLLPNINNEILAISGAGFIGVLLIFVLSLGVGTLLNKNLRPI